MADIADFVTRAVRDLRGATLLSASARTAAPARSRTASRERAPQTAAAPSSTASTGRSTDAPVTDDTAPAKRAARTRTPRAPRAESPRNARKTAVATPAPGSAVEGLRCPLCLQGDIVVGRRAWGCARWREGCRMVIPFEVEGATVSDAQLRDLVMKGQTRPAQRTVDGETQKVRLRLDLSGDAPTVRSETATGTAARGVARGRAASKTSPPR